MLALFFLQLAYGKLCPVYQCGGSLFNSSNVQCVEKIGFTYYLGTCSEEFYTYCPPNESDSFCQLPISSVDINSSFVGEACTFDRNCLDSLCFNKTCRGLAQGAVCNFTTQCAVGTFCNNNICQPQGLAGDYCESDYDCKNSLGCLLNSCTDYFSQEVNQTLENCENGINYLCKSGACTVYEGVAVCLGNFSSESQTPVMCENDGDCVVYQDMLDLNYSTGCQCGYNGLGLSYCNLSPGDQDFQTFIFLMQQWLTSNQSQLCHTYTRTNLDCINQQANQTFAVNLTYYYWTVNMYPQIQGNDDCVQEIYTNTFWTAKNAYDNLPSNKKHHSWGIMLKIGVVLIGMF